jgi:phage gp36-like protein
MIYATEAEFIETFGELTAVEITNLEDPTATVVDATVMARGLRRASELIDGYVGARYSLPLPSVPPILRTLTLDIARYQMGHYGRESDHRARYEDALRQLQQIANGTLSLGLPEEDAPATLAPMGRVGPVPTARQQLGGWGWR